MEISFQDRRLIAALRKDGRATVTQLASSLGQSRATVQARMEKLLANGAIQRFTIEVDSAIEASTIRAITMIELEGAMDRSVTKALRNMHEVISLHSTNGNWDLVVQIETQNLPEFDRVLRKIREIRGVMNSETSLLLNNVST